MEPHLRDLPVLRSKKRRSRFWIKGGVDGRTREARIKAGRTESRGQAKHLHRGHREHLGFVE
jgi:hypothetical protein